MNRGGGEQHAAGLVGAKIEAVWGWRRAFPEQAPQARMGQDQQGGKALPAAVQTLPAPPEPHFG